MSCFDRDRDHQKVVADSLEESFFGSSRAPKMKRPASGVPWVRKAGIASRIRYHTKEQR